MKSTIEKLFFIIGISIIVGVVVGVITGKSHYYILGPGEEIECSQTFYEKYELREGELKDIDFKFNNEFAAISGILVFGIFLVTISSKQMPIKDIKISPIFSKISFRGKVKSKNDIEAAKPELISQASDQNLFPIIENQIITRPIFSLKKLGRKFALFIGLIILPLAFAIALIAFGIPFLLNNDLISPKNVNALFGSICFIAIIGLIKGARMFLQIIKK